MTSKNALHQIWKNDEGLTTLCLADERGDDCRKSLESDDKLIHTFYAESHFQAMTIYYEYMGFGIYTSEFEIDKIPYQNYP